MKGRRSKYGAKPTIVDGVRYASKAEARRGAELAILHRAGEITDLILQPRYPLKVNGQLVTTYVADFAYHTKDGEPVTEDVKGVETPEFKLKRKLLRALMGMEIRIIRA